MDKKKIMVKPYPSLPAKLSGEFQRAKTLSEPARKQSGEQEIKLELDFDELEDETPTKKIRYLENIDQLKEMLGNAVVFSRVGNFDPKHFAQQIVCMDMCTTDKSGKNPYYYLEDSNGNQYRLYMNPTENIATERVNQSKRVVLEFGEQVGILFPLHFPKDERVER